MNGDKSGNKLWGVVITSVVSIIVAVVALFGTVSSNNQVEEQYLTTEARLEVAQADAQDNFLKTEGRLATAEAQALSNFLTTEARLSQETECSSAVNISNSDNPRIPDSDKDAAAQWYLEHCLPFFRDPDFIGDASSLINSGEAFIAPCADEVESVDEEFTSWYCLVPELTIQPEFSFDPVPLAPLAGGVYDFSLLSVTPALIAASPIPIGTLEFIAPPVFFPTREPIFIPTVERVSP